MARGTLCSSYSTPKNNVCHLIWTEYPAFSLEVGKYFPFSTKTVDGVSWMRMETTKAGMWGGSLQAMLHCNGLIAGPITSLVMLHAGEYQGGAKRPKMWGSKLIFNQISSANSTFFGLLTIALKVLNMRFFQDPKELMNQKVFSLHVFVMQCSFRFEK